MISPLRIPLLCLVLCVAAAALGIFTASSTIPGSNVGKQQIAIDANALKPAACTMTLTTLVTTPANGTAGNDLILGTNVGATFNGNGGQDCMVGGAGADTFKGNGNHAGDVCIGNGGTDVNSGNKCQFFTQ